MFHKKGFPYQLLQNICMLHPEAPLRISFTRRVKVFHEVVGDSGNIITITVPSLFPCFISLTQR